MTTESHSRSLHISEEMDLEAPSPDVQKKETPIDATPPPGVKDVAVATDKRIQQDTAQLSSRAKDAQLSSRVDVASGKRVQEDTAQLSSLVETDNKHSFVEGRVVMVANQDRIDRDTAQLSLLVNNETNNTSATPTLEDVISLPQSLPGQAPPPQSQRGAYYGAPGEELRPAPGFTPSQLPTQERQPIAALTIPTSNGDDETGLVEAQPISEHFIERGQATQMDPEDKDVPRKCLGYLTLLPAVALILVIIGVTVALTRDNDTTTDTTTSPPTTPAPTTTSPTNSPTNSPTQAPLIMNNLPNYTLVSLEDPLSPQAKAYEWLEDHPNITHLEDWRRRQVFALATIYHALDGPNWPLGLDKDWLDYKKPECDWYSNLLGVFSHDSSQGAFTYGEKGFACNEKGEYIQLRMASAHDHGYSLENVFFPAEFGLLTSMEDIRMNNNGFFGVSTEELFPRSFYELTNLRELHVGNNQLDTRVPSELGLLTNLETLKLSENNFTGPIPSQLGLLSNLEFLDLQTNQLTGRLPSELGQLTALKRFRVNANQLTGSLPSSLANLGNLTDLNLSDNNFSGAVPNEMGLPEGRLGSFRLDNNPQLSGTIPAHLCPLQAPDCTYLNGNNKEKGCSLTFDCSDVFCGCECECSNTTVADGDKLL